MKHILVELMSQLTTLTEAETLSIETSFQIQTFEKKTFLLKEGQVAKDSYFVIKGCVREYKLIDGEEITTAFFTENDSVVNFDSISNQTPSKKNFICNERTTVAIMNAEKEEALYRQHPRFEQFCRKGMEQMMGANQDQLSELITLKPEQRYRKLQAEKPDLLNRTPQYQIASYLGIQPETLSRIRKKMGKQQK